MLNKKLNKNALYHNHLFCFDRLGGYDLLPAPTMAGLFQSTTKATPVKKNYTRSNDWSALSSTRNALVCSAATGSWPHSL